MPLNDRQIKALKPKEKQYKVSDGGGMFLLIHPSGSKYWRLKYRIDGKEKLMALGVYPDVPLVDARYKREEAKLLIRQGIDPNEVKKQEIAECENKVTHTFKSVADRWLEIQATKLAPKTIRNHKIRLNKHLYPVIGEKNIAEIRRSSLIAVGENMNSAGIYEDAKKTIQTAGQVFEYAIIKEMVKTNPARGITKILEHMEEQHHPALPQSQVTQFFKDFLMIGGEEVTKHSLLLTMLTAGRSKSIRTSKWEHINFDDKTWYMPVENMKMSNDFLLPLSNWSIEILEKRYESSGLSIMV